VRYFISIILVSIPLLLTFYAWKTVSQNIYNENLIHFQSLALESEKALIHKMDSYNSALLGGAGFFKGFDEVTPPEWKTYITAINPQKSFPGVNGFGYIDNVKPENLDDYKQHGRNMYGEFEITPETQDLPYYIITFIEPLNINEKALGLNIGFEMNRREAAALSRDTGNTALTKRIILVQDSEQTPGFLLLHPLYKTPQMPATVQERQDNIRGWVYAPLIAKNFLNDLTRMQGNSFNLNVYDGLEENPDALIYKSNDLEDMREAKFIIRKELNIMQQKWLVVWKSSLSFEQSRSYRAPYFIILGGLLFTVLFSVFLLVTNIRDEETLKRVSEDKRHILPAIIFFATSVGALYMYSTLRGHEYGYIQNLVNKDAGRIEELIELRTNDKLLSLKRMAQRWTAAEGTPYLLWQQDAKNYVNHLTGLRTVEWVDQTYHVKWVEPEVGNEQALGLNIVFDEDRKKALEGAREKGNITVTPPLDLVQGYKAIIAYAPVYIGDDFNGYMVGIFAVQDMLNYILSKENADEYKVSVKHDEQEFYLKESYGAKLEEQFASKRLITISDKTWDLTIVPSQSFVKSKLSNLPILVLGAGLLIALLLALTVRYILMAKYRAANLRRATLLRDAILASTKHMIIATDIDGKVLLINKQVEVMLGIRKDDVVGKIIPKAWLIENELSSRAKELTNELGHPVNANFDVFSKKASLNEIDTYEWTFVRSNLETFPVRLTVTPIRNPRGDIEGFLGVAEDISEWKLNQQALKASEETFRSAMENASIGMALVAPDGKWLKVNKAICNLVGYSRAELLDIDFQTITHPDDLKKDLGYLNQVLANEIPAYQMEKRYIHKDGHTIWVLLNVTLVRDDDDKPKYFIAQIQDITERREMERMKNEFISVVSHELRTPLTSIRGSLGLIEGTMSDELSEKANKLISIAYKNCERLILLINDILDLDKLNAGQMNFDLADVNLAELVRQGVEVNEPYGDKFDVSFTIQSEDESILVRVDDARWQQVFSNLLSNAAKFSPKGGEVLIVVENMDGIARVSVQDKGPGIPEEFRSKIFTKFSQADNPLTRKKGGTGLGLNISQQIVEKMGGNIGFDSTPGKGSSFWFEFPIQFSYGTKNKMPSHRILVCEDDDLMAQKIKTTLQTEDFAIDIANNVDEARALMDLHAYDVMTLDVMLSNSREFIKEMKANKKTENMPIIILSAASDETKKLSGKALGMADWLEKPIEVDELKKAFDRILKGQDGVPKVLHIEDDLDLSAMLKEALQGKAELINAPTLRDAENSLGKTAFSLIILDIGLPDGSGLKFLESLHQSQKSATPIMILSADEVDMATQHKVAQAMVKSRVSEEKIINSILSYINSSSNKK